MSNRPRDSALGTLDGLAVDYPQLGGGGVGDSWPDPTGARTWERYGRHLRELYNHAGRPSYRNVERRSKRAGHPISKGSAQSLATMTVRRERRTVLGFLYGCGLPANRHAAWLAAWDAVNSPESPALPIAPGDPVKAVEAAVRQALVDAAVSFGASPALVASYPITLGDVVGYALIAQAELNNTEVDALLTFLGSADFRHLVPQIAVLWSPTSYVEGMSAALRDQLIHGMRHATGIRVVRLERVADGLLTALGDPAVRGIFDSVPRSVVVPDLARVTATANARLLASATDLGAFRDVASRLRSLVALMHAEIRLPHTGQNRSVPWASLYVPPALTVEAKVKDPGDQDFWLPARHTVILGDPGAGKSSLATKLAYDVATSTDDGRRDLVPFMVVLRDLSAALNEGERSLVEHLVSVCRVPYHVTTGAAAVEYLLLNGRALIILDGLDELADVGLRARVVRQIEGFVAAFPATPVVVTSRRIGYFDAPLSPSVFTTYLIEGFTAEQVRSYASRWFALDDGSPPHDRETLATTFLNESASIDDLRSNPLLLSLLCAMYAAEHFIPTNRAQVYERCALLIFERWDRMRQVVRPQKFEGEVRTAVQRLAWRLLSGGGPTEMPRPQILRLLVHHLLAKGYDEDEAAPMAEEFLDFCAGRAWVLEELGMAGPEPVYGFAHRTFLEFFAAEFLVRNHSTPEQVWAQLTDRVGEASWEMVGQVAVQLLERNLDRGADRLVSAALEMVRDPGVATADAILRFVTRVFNHAELSPPVVTRAVNIALDRVLTLGLTDRIVDCSAAKKAATVNVVDTPLQTMMVRSLDTNLRSVRRALVDRLAAETAADLDSALLLTEHLDHELYSHSEVGSEVVRRSAEAFERWNERQPWRILSERGSDPAVLADVLERFGPEPLYLQQLVLGVGHPPAWTAPFCVAGPTLPGVERLGALLIDRTRPWLPWPAAPPAGQLLFNPTGALWQPDGSALATVALLALPYLESDARIFRSAPHGRELLLALADTRATTIVAAQARAQRESATVAGVSPNDLSDAIDFEVRANRAASEAADQCQASLDDAGVRAAARLFLESWARNEIRVTG
ncbi:NACHT domain-containing protein [Micromonospora sp. NPDC048935]|uniref:NACHT domain-containing protein n=1 Tax=Micromonospora sp. NPDC048935 TaxID=3364262 RepID=UPI0037128D52